MLENIGGNFEGRLEGDDDIGTNCEGGGSMSGEESIQRY